MVADARNLQQAFTRSVFGLVDESAIPGQLIGQPPDQRQAADHGQLLLGDKLKDRQGHHRAQTQRKDAGMFATAFDRNAGD